ncbi:Homogentisate 1,2-dioxygenase [Fusarium sp. MPI-SDFR-AT-0072]|nr:Homogentisate 1,2-dioxygenase [Fusarium sp. MPI-SDFR-AT-0072]
MVRGLQNNKDRLKPKTLSTFTVKDPYEYSYGMSNYHESETIPGVNPVGCIHPQRSFGNLFLDRLTGSPFMIARKDNKQTYFHRTLPSTSASQYKEWKPDSKLSDLKLSNLQFKPIPYMFQPQDIDETDDFLAGLRVLAGVGDPAMRKGLAYYIYTAAKSMPSNQVFTSSDGDLLLGCKVLDIRTEMGPMRLRPGEIAVVPRGIRFHVSIVERPIRGYVVETFMNHFELPELGIIGSSGLANTRDFQIPRLQEYKPGPDTEIINKYCGELFSATMKGTVFNVIGWHGTSFPFKYDLGKYCTMGAISYDHADPCIWTVLTIRSDVEGTPAVDILAIPPRWVVHEDTFRPPSFHRNVACEFIAIVKGSLDGAQNASGMSTIYNGMTPHGPTRKEWDTGISEEQLPVRINNDNMLVMFESS